MQAPLTREQQAELVALRERALDGSYGVADMKRWMELKRISHTAKLERRAARRARATVKELLESLLQLPAAS